MPGANEPDRGALRADYSDMVVSLRTTRRKRFHETEPLNPGVVRALQGVRAWHTYFWSTTTR
jgi:hypothetical protein